MRNQEGLHSLQGSLISFPEWASEQVLQQIRQLKNYEPMTGARRVYDAVSEPAEPVDCPTKPCLPALLAVPRYIPLRWSNAPCTSMRQQ